MAVAQITQLPIPVPTRADPANFAARADLFLGALPGFATQANALATYVNGRADDANTSANESKGFRDAASLLLSQTTTLVNQKVTEMNQIKSTAVSELGVIKQDTIDELETLSFNTVQLVEQASQTALANSNFKGEWSNLTGALSVPAVVRYNGVNWMLLKNIANVQSQAPAVNSEYWEVASSFSLNVMNITENTNARGGIHYALRPTATAKTLTMPDPLTLPDGTIIAFSNVSGGGNWTIDFGTGNFLGQGGGLLTVDTLDFSIIIKYDAPSNTWLQLMGNVEMADTNIMKSGGLYNTFADIPFNVQCDLNPTTDASNTTMQMPQLSGRAAYWWVVNKFGSGTRGYAQAVQVLTGTGVGALFINTVVDNVWTGWVQK